VLLRREARYNHKLVERHYRELGLALRRKKRKRLARVPFPPAERANQEWAMDFVSDAVASGRHVRIKYARRALKFWPGQTDKGCYAIPTV
jgi:putative transposase